MAKDATIKCRVDPNLADKLIKEGLAMGLDLSNYLRFLIATHPKRKH